MPQSYERAAELWKQAAAQGNTDAKNNLGALYCNGLGVPKDVARGVALFKQAAAGGNKAATDSCGRWARPCRGHLLQGRPNPWTDGARHRREGVARTGTGGPIVQRPCRVRAVARAMQRPHCSVPLRVSDAASAGSKSIN